MQAASTLMQRFTHYIIDPLILLIFATGFFLFVWGLVQFLYHLEDGSGREKGKQHMLWGIVGMLVMVSVYGIISFIDNTFDLNLANPDINHINNVNPPANFF